MCGILFLDQDVYQILVFDYISKHLETQKNHLCPFVFVLFLITLIAWCTYNSVLSQVEPRNLSMNSLLTLPIRL